MSQHVIWSRSRFDGHSSLLSSDIVPGQVNFI